MIPLATDELKMLRDSAARYLAARAPAEAAQGWHGFAKMGWIAAALPAARGGIAEGNFEMAVIAEALGSALAAEPYATLAVQTQQLLAAVSATALLEAVQDGRRVLVVVQGEIAARAPEGEVRLHGHARHLLGGPLADGYLIVASDGDRRGLWLVDADTPGVERSGYETLDGRAMADLRLVDVAPGTRLAENLATSALDAGADLAALAVCAETIGSMERVLKLTCDHLAIRQQFGQPLAGFQVLRHRIADMYMELEEARCLVESAHQTMDAGDSAAIRRMVSATKLRVGAAAAQLGAIGIQLHGAIGLCEEYEVGRHYRRLLVNERLFGDQQFHLARFREGPDER